MAAIVVFSTPGTCTKSAMGASHSRRQRREELLVSAACSGDLEQVQALVKSGVLVDAKGWYGMTPLMLASQENKLDVARYLVGAGAQVDAVNEAGKAALMLAAERGKSEVVQYLVGIGANVRALGAYGTTVLMYAASSGSLGAVRVLVEAGANTNAVDFQGQTPLVYAAAQGNLDVTRYLINAGADVNAVDDDGETPLLYAARAGKLEVAQCLVDAGAEVSIADRLGHNAIFTAASFGHLEVQQLLAGHIRRSPNSTRSPEAVIASRPSQSWFISPFEVALESVPSAKSFGGEYRVKWLDADVMVKLFIPDATVASLEQEVAVWHQLRHPNVVKLYGACNVGHNFFVFEVAANGSLNDYLAARDQSGAQCAVWQYLYDAALGLAYLHERNIVHGNLRCSNILVGSDGLAKLTGVGLSGSAPTRASGCTADGVFGSGRWQSPERLEGGGVDVCVRYLFAGAMHPGGNDGVDSAGGPRGWIRQHVQRSLGSLL